MRKHSPKRSGKPKRMKGLSLKQVALLSPLFKLTKEQRRLVAWKLAVHQKKLAELPDELTLEL
jgi:hypothetical protein